MPINVKQTIDELLSQQKAESELPVSTVLLEDDEPRLGEYDQTPESGPVEMPPPPESVEQPIDEEISTPEPGEDAPLPETESYEPPEVSPQEQPEQELRPDPVAQDAPLPETSRVEAPPDFDHQRQQGEPVVMELPDIGPGSVQFENAQWSPEEDFSKVLESFGKRMAEDTGSMMAEAVSRMKAAARDEIHEAMSQLDRGGGW